MDAIVKAAKQFGPPAVLSLAGIKASELFGLTKTWQQVGAACVGAFAGVYLASKI